MPKRISREKPDAVQNVIRVAQESVKDRPGPKPVLAPKTRITQSVISQVMSKLGRKGGKIGGKRRLQTMTLEQRSQAALKAAQARWGKRGGGG
jgi:hypothetical protein